MPESAIQPATEAEMQLDSDQERPINQLLFKKSPSLRPTLLSCRSCNVHVIVIICKWFTLTTSLPPSLVSSRRTFLAALILASKFSQDKCYSNRAWAPNCLAFHPEKSGVVNEPSVTTARSIVRSDPIAERKLCRYSTICTICHLPESLFYVHPSPSRQYDNSSQNRKLRRQMAQNDNGQIHFRHPNLLSSYITSSPLGMAKLSDANNAGTIHTRDCTLILTEGDSAKALAVAGLGSSDETTLESSLRGKLLNVREAKHDQIMKNEERGDSEYQEDHGVAA